MEVKGELVDAQFEMVQYEDIQVPPANNSLAELAVKISKVVFVLSTEVTYVGTTAGWTRLGGGGILGDIKTSDLKPSQFLIEAGPTWVLADGRSTIGSDYTALTGRNNIPDHRALTLRGLNEDEDTLGLPRTDGLADPDGQKAVGSSHNFKTSANGLSNAGAGNHTHALNTVGFNNPQGVQIQAQFNYTSVQGSTSPAGAHNHAISGANETVSSHGSVYIYIKINR